MKELIASVPILFEGKQFKIGDRLPTADRAMVQAWLDADTASWRTMMQLFNVQEDAADHVPENGEDTQEGEEIGEDDTPEPEQAIPVSVIAVQECADVGISGTVNGVSAQGGELVGTLPLRPKGRNKKQ